MSDTSSASNLINLKMPQSTVQTDWRALCAELLNVFESYDDESNLAGIFDDMKANKNDLLNRARAALAQQEPEVVGPSDEELLRMAAEALGYERISPGRIYGAAEAYGDELLAFARAVLARWGRPAPVPTGEVGELVAALRADAECAEVEHYGLCNMTADQMRRAADLLSIAYATGPEVWEPIPQLPAQAAPVPVPSDTRYEFSVLDTDFTEQAGGTAPTYAQALSGGQHYLAQYLQDGPHTLELRRVEVLPPGAFPLPAGEVQP